MSHAMNVVFLGGMFPKESNQWIQRNSKGNIQNAANVLQWNLVDGFAAQLGNRLKVISSLFVGAYPKRFKKLKLDDRRFPVSKDVQGLSVGFYNIPLFKHFSKYWSLQMPLKEALHASSGRNVLIAYSFTYAMVYSLRRAKRRDASVITCLIVPDLPEMMNLSKDSNRIRRLLKAATLRSLYSTLKYVDCMVVLTEPMITRMQFSKPYVVIEGIADAAQPELTTWEVNESDNLERPTVLYSGGLNESYGVLLLVEAFLGMSDPSAQLILCGAGDAEPRIREFAAKDERIILKGLIPREEVIALQKTSTVLVNPRQNIGEYVKYSFPSKILEYLSSGTPVIAYDLEGVPAEYKNYLISVPDNSIASLRNAIQDVCNLPSGEREELGQKARQFVTELKNPVVQTGKIIRMISAVAEGRGE